MSESTIKQLRDFALHFKGGSRELLLDAADEIVRLETEEKRCHDLLNEATVFGDLTHETLVDRVETIIRYEKRRSEQLGISETEIKRMRVVEDAFKCSEYDISPCMVCGHPVVCVPDGTPMCNKCADEEANGD